MTTVKKIYTSKISLGILIFIILVFVISGFVIIDSNVKNNFGVAVYVLTILFIAYLFVTTNYTIYNQQTLIVKSGFLVNKKIDINSITKISKTNNPISSPALSLDRIEIFYNKYDSVIISPKNEQEFIQDLQKINSSIIIN